MSKMPAIALENHLFTQELQKPVQIGLSILNPNLSVSLLDPGHEWKPEKDLFSLVG
jgi:hypothetical protein